MWTSTVAAPLAGRRAPVKGDSPPAVSLASTAATGPPLPPVGFDRTASVPLGFFGHASTRAAVGVLATEPHRPDNAQRTAGKTFTIALYGVPDVAAQDSHRPRAAGRPKRFSSERHSRSRKFDEIVEQPSTDSELERREQQHTGLLQHVEEAALSPILLDIFNCPCRRLEPPQHPIQPAPDRSTRKIFGERAFPDPDDRDANRNDELALLAPPDFGVAAATTLLLLLAATLVPPNSIWIAHVEPYLQKSQPC
ncbi:hypothetical protein HPB51_012208 [Rhipicephalus microplus]|uniref:Uncharacterized protein n=1 Tax=Rhipicephalus microplus TaxID=6941 RepID=A0A9J6E9A4_RHIMP|nr:hypothetical protein HPB51_012208 [Rhipicephalus microplus]